MSILAFLCIHCIHWPEIGPKDEATLSELDNTPNPDDIDHLIRDFQMYAVVYRQAHEVTDLSQRINAENMGFNKTEFEILKKQMTKFVGFMAEFQADYGAHWRKKLAFAAVEPLAEIYRQVSKGHLSVEDSELKIINEVFNRIDLVRQANLKRLKSTIGTLYKDEQARLLIATQDEIREARGPMELAKDRLGILVGLNRTSMHNHYKSLTDTDIQSVNTISRPTT